LIFVVKGILLCEIADLTAHSDILLDIFSFISGLIHAIMEPAMLSEKESLMFSFELRAGYA